MSAADIETTRTAYALLNERDYVALWKILSPEFVLDFSRRLIDPGVFRGRDQVQDFWDRAFESWEAGSFSLQPVQLIDAGDKVLVSLTVSGRGKTSGAKVESHVWLVWAYRDGVPVEMTYFGEDRAAASEAAGLDRP